MTLFPLHGKAVVFNVPKVKCGLLNNKIKILQEIKKELKVAMSLNGYNVVGVGIIGSLVFHTRLE